MQNLPLSWSWDLLILTLLIITTAIYLRGLGRLYHRQRALHLPQIRRAATFTAGILALFAALISPLDTLSTQLFSVHMVQHILIMDITAPLLAYSAPLGPILLVFPFSVGHAIGQWWSQPANRVRAVWAWITRPAAAWSIFAGFLWVWHVPALYTAAVENDAVHAIEHFCFLGGGLLFWWTALYTLGRKPAKRGKAALFLFTYALQSSILGALLTLASRPWYPIYSAVTSRLGTTPLADQQLAGLMMWVPEGTIYTVASLLMLRAWLEGTRRAGDK